MFRGTSQNYDAVKILSKLDQYNLFEKYLGLRNQSRFYSPFRKDANPGCRFKWHSGFLYLVENSKYKNKLYWSIYDAIAEVYNISFRDAVTMVAEDHKSVLKDDLLLQKQIIKSPTTIDIRFESVDWENDNIFKLSNEVLTTEYVYKVSNYWIGENGVYTKNKFHNPKKELTIAYYFPDSGHVKLYWPHETNFKWYSNCNNNDIFGKYKLKQYLKSDNNLILTKSQKDRLILDYHAGFNTIATQNEGSYLPKKLVNILTNVNVYVLFDNDPTGHKLSKIFNELYGFTIIKLNKKDAYETYISCGIDYLKNEIYSNY